jgi:signal transduction histidine kinase
MEALVHRGIIAAGACGSFLRGFMTSELADQLSRIQVGDHLCLLYESAAEALPLAASFLKDGLDRGEHALYIVDDHALEVVQESLLGAGIDVDGELQRGALRFLDARQYCPLQEFEPQAMLARFRELGDEMARAGIPAARAAVEMTWALTVGAPLDKLAEYECWGNQIFEHFTGMSLCMYNRRRFPAASMDRLLRAHPLVIVGGEVAPNPFYEPPEIFFAAEDRQARRFEWMLEQLKRARQDRRARQELVASERAARAVAEASRRDRLLAEASAMLAAADDPQDAIRQVADQVVPQFADACVIGLLSADGSMRLPAVAYAEVGAARATERLLRRIVTDGALPDLDGGEAGPGAARLYALTEAGTLQHTAASGNGAGAMPMPPDAALVVPLVVGGQACGVVALAQGSTGRRFDVQDVRFVEELGRRITGAIQTNRASRAEEQARLRAEEMSKAKSRFLAVISHELRTPLNAIIGYHELLQDEIAGPLTERQRHYLERVDASARHLLTLIDEVLELSRIEAGREEVHLESLDAADLARDAHALILPQAEKKGLNLILELPGEDLVIRSDPGKLRQILLNLLANAVKFTDVGNVSLRLELDAAGDVVFRVTDSGVGIAPGDLDRVFEPFEQVDWRERDVGGTGLGLTVCLSLARLLGADLQAESEPGKGSEFMLKLPPTVAGEMPAV